MIRSLRGRLLFGTSLAGITVLGLLGLSVYAAMRHALMDDFDASLRTEARIVAGMVEQDGSKIGFEFDPRQMPDFISGIGGRFFEVWGDDGKVLARSPSLENLDLPKPAASEVIGQTDLPGSRAGRSVMVPFIPTQQEQDDSQPRIAPRAVSIVVAGEPLEALHTLRLLAGMLTLLCAAAVMVMGAIEMRVVGQSVLPIETLAAEIESLRETDLSRRFTADGVPDELKPVVEKLNGLLTRLERAFTREKLFTADAAHELRTPLAGLRSTLEVCRSRPRDRSGYEAALDECIGITNRMEAMVRSLLLLARTEAGQLSVENRPLDLCRLVSESWSLFQHQAEQRALRVILEMPPACSANTDADKFQIVLHNVFDNAVSHANEGGRLHVLLRLEAETATIEIANSGSEIATNHEQHIFERFWRGDSARSDAGFHCGLGLSLSQRLMVLLNGNISARTVKGGEFVVTLTIPRRVELPFS